jgi:hypothetical protein
MSETTLRTLTAEEERLILTRFGLVSMNDSFIIENPFGISVFGSALLRVSPDTVTIHAAITRLEPKPTESFAQARQGAQAVTKFLKGLKIKDFGLSRLSVSQEYRVVNQERKMVGYRAKIALTVIFTQLDLIEEVVSGLVEAGVDEVSFIEFSTSQLKELRTQARQLAMDAAREKAENYAAAAKVALGNLLHIQDVNPMVLQRHTGRLRQNTFHISGLQHEAGRHEGVDHEAGPQSLDPEAIEVGAAVLAAFRIGS